VNPYRIAIAHLADSRADFLAVRKDLIAEELRELEWLTEAFSVIESEPLNSFEKVDEFVRCAQRKQVAALVIHLPIWADPIFSVRLALALKLPTVLLGNLRPDTSSIVGLLGAGGALDQVGFAHRRIFDPQQESSRKEAIAYLTAACVRQALVGETVALFGGRSLGIFTAVADPAQWQRLFGIDLVYLDQLEIQRLAEGYEQAAVDRHVTWLSERLGGITFSGNFTPDKLEKQVRSYLATRDLAKRHRLNCVGVKCQPEMSDGYVSQCVAHFLANSALDADGEKPILIHACESDADGALTMFLMHRLSRGKPVGLLDVRWYDERRQRWTLANCGAVPPAFGATSDDPSGLSSFQMVKHAFGTGGGGAITAVIAPQPVTLARLCRRSGEYWLAVLPAEVIEAEPELVNRVTPAFPKASVRMSAGTSFLNEFCSNHIHMVTGEITAELQAFCELTGIRARIWS
jgi:L-fucose isomerase